MPPVALIAAAVGSVGSTIAGAVGANQKEQAMKSAALPSIKEIQTLEAATKNQEITIARERKIMDAIDPAIMEAGKQAHQMLLGQESAMLDPIRRQRARQKQGMEETLRRQLGPGYQTSSAGIEALSRFDAETSDHLAGAQQNAVNSLLGVSQNARGQAQTSESNAMAQGLQTAGLWSNIKGREMQSAQAAGGAANAIGKGFSNIASAGASFGTASMLSKAPPTAAGVASSEQQTNSFASVAKQGNYSDPVWG